MLRKGIYRIALVIGVVGFSLGSVIATGSDSLAISYLPIIIKGWPTSSPRSESLLISEVLYNPTGEEPDGEWVELFNASIETIILSNYKLGDAETFQDHEGMYRFPQDTVLSPGQVIIIAYQSNTFSAKYLHTPDFEFSNTDPSVPDMDKYYIWANGNINLNNLGDELILLDGHDEMVDSVSWGSSTFAFNPSVPGVSDGHSIERWPAHWDQNIANDWIDQSQPTPGIVDIRTPTPIATMTPTPTFTRTMTPILCESAELLVSEVLYDPDQQADPDGEWFEVYNNGNNSINLSCVRVGDEETNLGGEGMLTFPNDAVISPGGVIVIANRADVFEAMYNYYPDYETRSSLASVPDMVNCPEYASGSVDLNNEGDDILLLDQYDNIVDAVSWGSSNFAFYPSVSRVTAGSSIERIPANVDTDTASDWTEQSDPKPGNVDTLLPTQMEPTSTMTPTPTSTFTPTPSSTATSTLKPTLVDTDTPPTVRSILISELLYDPDGVEPDGEWVEIWNAGVDSANLANYKIGDEEVSGGNEGMLQFPPGFSILSNQVVIIANTAIEFNLIFGFLPDFEIYDTRPDVPNMLVYVTWSSGEFRLDNLGDEIILLDESDQVIDDLSYGQSEYLGFFPPVPLVSANHSIERFPADVDTNTNSDWREQENPDPGSVAISSPE